MRPGHASTWRVGANAAAVALGFALAGCSDFSQHHFGGVRQLRDDAAEAPKPAPALAMPNPPISAAAVPDSNVKPAAFVPLRDLQPAVDPNAQALNAPLHILHQRAAQRHAGMDSYIYRLRRREVVGGKPQPEEIIRVHVRQQPYSVHLKWVGDKSKGREVVYVRGKYDNKMQVLLAPGDPFSWLTRRHSLALDDPMVKSGNRYPITETGFGSLIARFGQLVAMIDKGDTGAGTLKYLGQVERPEFKAKVEAVLQTLPAGSDPGLPKGGQRYFYFDIATGLPALVIATDANAAVEYEYYCYDNVLWPAPMDDSDFDPDRLWRK